MRWAVLNGGSSANGRFWVLAFARPGRPLGLGGTPGEGPFRPHDLELAGVMSIRLAQVLRLPGR